ncbi:uncharacterized protein LOC135085041 isoform X3 [Ostrinia nubilalis]|uniref:uncharacterized protein LOC135085041 isoform X3 n=1 Tax=Ostrinia nubilalis TaxID=29057 RepID=UPI0030824FBA
MNVAECSFNRKEDEEPNPKTMQLSQLIQLIDPKHLSYYLETVASFLKNSKRDLWFPNISPQLDAFLVRMIQDTQNLRSLLNHLDVKSKALAVDIIETLDNHKDEFIVVHSYVNSNFNKNVLLYRKVVNNRLSDSPVVSNFQRMCPVQRPSTSERAKESARQNPPDRSGTDNPLSYSFKSQWVDFTLRFIQDHTADCLEFPEMSIDQAEFVYSLIQEAKLDSEEDPKCKALYAPLQKALKVFNENHEFKVSFLYLAGDEVRLNLEKVPLNNNRGEAQCPDKNARKKNSPKEVTSVFIQGSLQTIWEFINEEANGSILFRNANDAECSFLQRILTSIRSKNKKLHASFLEESKVMLRKIVAGLRTCPFDLKLAYIRLEQNRTLKNVCISKVPKERNCTSTSACSTPIRQNINAPENIVPRPSGSQQPSTSAQSSNQNIARTTEGWQVADRPPTINNKVERRDDHAVPTTSNTSTNKIEKSDAQALTSNVNVKVTKNTATNLAGNNAQIKNDTNLKKEPVIDNTGRETSSLSVTVKNAATDNSTLYNASDSVDSGVGIDNGIESEGAMKSGKSIAAAVYSLKTKRDRSEAKGLGLRKARLIEALSVPLESDVAMRMMRQMGWKGGPLGTRGDGILEPIMPDLNRKSNAGLGHVAPKKEPKPQKPQAPPPKAPQATPPKPQAPPPAKLAKTIHCHKPPNLRADLLGHIHYLITEEYIERVVVYSAKMGKKDITFLKGVLKSIETRTQQAFNDEVQQETFKKILVEMVAAPDLQVGCVIGGDKRSICFTKHGVPSSQKTCDQQYMPLDTVISVASKYRHAKLITTDIIMDIGKHLGPRNTVKCNKAIGHRIILLTSVLDLVTGNKLEKELNFDYILTCKQVGYVNEMVIGINARVRWSHSTCFENHLMVEILKVLKETTLVLQAVFANNNQLLKFQKTSTTGAYQPRFTNSSLEDKIDNKDSAIPGTSKQTIEKDSQAKNNKNDAKIDSKTGQEVIVISDSDESFKKEAKGECSTANTSFESEFEKDVNELKEAIKAADDNLDEKDHVSAKRLRSDSDGSHGNKKKTKINTTIKYLGIAPDSYPLEEVGIDEIMTFQNKVCEHIEKKKEKPLLECLGIKNGAIIYCCHDEFARFLVESVANNMNLKTINITNLYKNKKKQYKMSARINSYLDLNLKKLFATVEDYNPGLKTDLWGVIDVQNNTGYVNISLEVDEESFEYISDNNFSIFAGMDKLRFNLLWE